jgi:NAD(P)-dependent dehydrogenase (short-subunit alcohol dehydrogenase family)
MHFHHTDEGNEEHLAIHCLANFIMVNLLLPQMVKSCHAAPSELASPDAIEGRIVLVSSSEHRNGKLDWNDPNWHHRQPSLTDRIMWRTYADAKLAESLVARDLAFRLSKAHINITSNFVQPGACDTKLHRYDAYSHFRGWVSAYRSPDQGALGPCFIAAREEATGRSGEYWKDDVVAKASRKVTLRDAKRMWQLCEQLTGITWNAGQTVH